tara:strand:+ start:1514 stop:2689 length:1176 start_codon:yes stop_codon:yes gene_type:complete
MQHLLDKETLIYDIGAYKAHHVEALMSIKHHYLRHLAYSLLFLSGILFLTSSCSVKEKTSEIIKEGLSGEGPQRTELWVPDEYVSTTSEPQHFTEPSREKTHTDGGEYTSPPEKNEQVSEKDITYPAPQLHKMNPANQICYGIATTIELEGAHFRSDSSVLVEGKQVPSTFISPSSIKLSLTLPDGAEYYKIQVVPPSGATSNTLELLGVYEHPATQLDSINPLKAFVGQRITLHVHGNTFNKNDEIVFDGVTLPTTYISSSELNTQLDLRGKKPGSYDVWVKYAGCRMQKTTSVQIRLMEPEQLKPQLDRVLPLQYQLGKKYTLSIYGRLLPSNGQLLLDQTKLNFVYKSSTYIEAELDLTTNTWKAGTYTLTFVGNNGPSNGLPITITP